MDKAGEWQRLCALLDGDESVWSTVEAALQDGDDPWEALLTGLDDAGALASLQSDDTGMEVSDALAQLPRVFRLQPDLDEVTDTDDLDAALRVADAALREGELRLLRLVEDDEESWPLVVVLLDAVGEVRELVAALGHAVVTSD